MIALICDSWENFWREVLSPWGEIKTFSDGVTLAYYLQHVGPCDLAVVAVDGADGMNYCDYARHIRPGVRVLWVTQDADFAPAVSAWGRTDFWSSPCPGASRKIPCTASWARPAAPGDHTQNPLARGTPCPGGTSGADPSCATFLYGGDLMKHIRKNWRRFAAVLLSAALMISTVSQTAFAAGADTGKAIQFVDGGTAANISGGQASSVYFGTYPQNSAGSGGYHTDPNESGDVHTHCVCGGNGDVNGHEHDTAGTEWTEWTPADSLPDSAGSYYLTQSVSGSWTVPTGEVNLCLNGQTISGSITVGSGAKLTLTDCTGTGKLQGSGSGSGVSINGGTFNLYGGTITGFVNGVEIGSHNDIKTGSSFTMYGGAITSNEAGSSAEVCSSSAQRITPTRRASPCTAAQFPTTPQAHPTAVAAAYMWVRSAASPWTAAPSPATRQPLKQRRRHLYPL
ncbi:hypothetical protein M5E87_00545 [Flavonifractor plautii]|nr:hypothetical protein M5E87_00545 [Flavonifractor plautii]